MHQIGRQAQREGGGDNSNGQRDGGSLQCLAQLINILDVDIGADFPAFETAHQQPQGLRQLLTGVQCLPAQCQHAPLHRLRGITLQHYLLQHRFQGGDDIEMGIQPMQHAVGRD
ncbi:hypothetical protein D3C78_1406760 [compost metagenome]